MAMEMSRTGIVRDFAVDCQLGEIQCRVKGDETFSCHGVELCGFGIAFLEFEWIVSKD